MLPELFIVAARLVRRLVASPSCRNRSLMTCRLFAAAMSLAAAPAFAQDLSSKDLAKQLSVFDSNADGWVAGDELAACGCETFDLDGDRVISLAEFASAVVLGGSLSAPEPAPGGMPVAAPAVVAGPPEGRYGCFFWDYGTPIPAGNMISVLAPGEYQFYDGDTGRFEMDVGTGEIRWQSGPFSDNPIAANFYHRDSDGKPVIRLVLPEAGIDASGQVRDQTNYCILE